MRKWVPHPSFARVGSTNLTFALFLLSLIPLIPIPLIPALHHPSTYRKSAAPQIELSLDDELRRILASFPT